MSKTAIARAAKARRAIHSFDHAPHLELKRWRISTINSFRPCRSRFNEKGYEMELESSSSRTLEGLSDCNFAFFGASTPLRAGAARDARRRRWVDKPIRPFAPSSSPKGRQLRAYLRAIDPISPRSGLGHIPAQLADRFAGPVTRGGLNLNRLGRSFFSSHQRRPKVVALPRIGGSHEL